MILALQMGACQEDGDSTGMMPGGMMEQMMANPENREAMMRVMIDNPEMMAGMMEAMMADTASMGRMMRDPEVMRVMSSHMAAHPDMMAQHMEIMLADEEHRRAMVEVLIQSPSLLNQMHFVVEEATTEQ